MINEVINLFFQHLSLIITEDSLSYESLVMSKDELDTNLFPSEILMSITEEEVMTHVFMVDEYICYFIETVNSQQRLFTGISKENELLWYEGDI